MLPSLEAGKQRLNVLSQHDFSLRYARLDGIGHLGPSLNETAHSFFARHENLPPRAVILM